jgi:hypothetical protein
MASLLEVPLGMGLIGILLLLLLGFTVLVMIRSRKPDPKMELLLSLMKALPEDDNNGKSLGRGSQISNS